MKHQQIKKSKSTPSYLLQLRHEGLGEVAVLQKDPRADPDALLDEPPSHGSLPLAQRHALETLTAHTLWEDAGEEFKVVGGCCRLLMIRFVFFVIQVNGVIQSIRDSLLGLTKAVT